MSDQSTINPDQLPVVTEVPEDMRAVVFGSGGPLQAMPFDRLLAKLIATDLFRPNEAALQADLGHDADTVAFVDNDPTPRLNGWYRKVGASGAGNWDQFEELARSSRIAAETAAQTAIAAAALFVPFEDPGAIDDALRRITAIDLYEKVDGVELTWPENIAVEELARQADTDRARIRLMGANGAASPVTIVRESVGGAIFISVAGEEGVREYPLFAQDASLGVTAGTEVGRIRFDVTGAFGNYNSAYSATVSALNVERLFLSTAERQRIGAMIDASLGDEARRGAGPFAAHVRNDRLRDEIDWGGGWFTQDGHLYGIALAELSDFSGGAGFWRATYVIRDFTAGVDVARGGKNFDDDPTGQEHYIFCHQSTLPAYTGKHFLLRISADAQWTDSGVARTFSLHAEAGFKPEVCFSSSAVETFLLGEPTAHETVEVAAEGGDATGIVPGHAPFYDANYAAAADGSKFSVFPNSEVGFPRRILFDMIDDWHDEEVGRLVALPFSIRRGRGMFNTRFYNTDPALRVFENTWPVLNIGFAAEQFVDQYCDHIDNAGARSILAAAGDLVQNYFIPQGWDRVWYRAHGTDASAGAPSCIGAGISARQKWVMRRSLFEQVGQGDSVAAIFAHNSRNMPAGAQILIEDGTIVRSASAAQALQLITSFGQSHPTEVFVSADSVIQGGIQGNVNFEDGDSDPAMPARARDRWPFVIRGVVPDGIHISDPKMRVLELDDGTALTGSQAAIVALFGRGYVPATGRGDALTLDGSVQALSVKLNGLNGSTITLTRDGVGAEVLTIGDHAGQSEGAILAALNAQLTNFNIAPVRIDGEIAAETPIAV
ncbi:MAG: hypothetical protein AAGE86_02305 [Pseudomonadota bacterium]